MKVYNFKKSIGGNFSLCGVNIPNFPTNDNFLSLKENENFKSDSLFLVKTKSKTGKKRGVKNFQTWLKNHKQTK